MNILKKLLTPRSVMALAITGAFVYMAVMGKLNNESIMMVFTYVLGYWFGREQKENKEGGGNK